MLDEPQPLSPASAVLLDEGYNATFVQTHVSLVRQEPRNSIAKVHLTQAQERLQQSRGEYTAEQLYSGRIKQTGGHSPVTPAPSLALNKPKVSAWYKLLFGTCSVATFKSGFAI